MRKILFQDFKGEGDVLTVELSLRHILSAGQRSSQTSAFKGEPFCKCVVDTGFITTPLIP